MVSRSSVLSGSCSKATPGTRPVPPLPPPPQLWHPRSEQAARSTPPGRLVSRTSPGVSLVHRSHPVPRAGNVQLGRPIHSRPRREPPRTGHSFTYCRLLPSRPGGVSVTVEGGAHRARPQLCRPLLPPSAAKQATSPALGKTPEALDQVRPPAAGTGLARPPLRACRAQQPQQRQGRVGNARLRPPVPPPDTAPGRQPSALLAIPSRSGWSRRTAVRWRHLVASGPNSTPGHGHF